MRQPSILIVDDDRAIRSLFTKYLKTLGYYVYETWSVGSAKRLLASMKFDVVLLDLELDDGEGFDLLKADLNAANNVIVISVRQDVVDKIASFELGADDYIVKPVDLRELGLRLKRTLERGQRGEGATPLEATVDIDGKFHLNVASRTIAGDGVRPIALSSNEFRLLCTFLNNQRRVIRREEIALELMGKRFLGKSRAIDVLVSDVRRKLKAAETSLKLKSVRGEGYICEVEA